jgi:restriction system protein
MSIWLYENVSRQPRHVWRNGAICVFCQSKLTLLHEENEDISQIKTRGSQHERIHACPVCGWWKAERVQDIDNFVHHFHYYTLHGAAASLRDLDLSDVSIPIKEVRSYLAANYEKRGTVHPRLFEETVADVFRDHGYSAEVTAYSGDDGIDVILSRGREKIGVQVKRYKNDIEVEQIRSLAGALVLNGLTQGLFVTTSGFQSGGDRTTDQFRTRGYQIELYDAEKFYEALHIAQRNMYKSFDEFPIVDILRRLQIIEDCTQERYDLSFRDRLSGDFFV